jgi:hypothetical protein
VGIYYVINDSVSIKVSSLGYHKTGQCGSVHLIVNQTFDELDIRHKLELEKNEVQLMISILQEIEKIMME